MKQIYIKYNKIFLILCLTILSFLYIKRDKVPTYELLEHQTVEKEIIGLEDLSDHEGQDTMMMQSIPVAVIPALESAEKVPIYVCGQVENPDVYYLYETDIIKQAIMAAGGFTADADKNAWNLAMQIQKGIKIDVPKVGEQIDKTHDSYDNSIRETDAPNKLININKADSQTLTTLPGIGPVTAQNIIEFRNTSGEFKSLQDVKNVPRIGQVTLDKIKDHICFQ